MSRSSLAVTGTGLGSPLTPLLSHIQGRSPPQKVDLTATQLGVGQDFPHLQLAAVKLALRMLLPRTCLTGVTTLQLCIEANDSAFGFGKCASCRIRVEGKQLACVFLLNDRAPLPLRSILKEFENSTSRR